MSLVAVETRASGTASNVERNFGRAAGWLDLFDNDQDAVRGERTGVAHGSSRKCLDLGSEYCSRTAMILGLAERTRHHQAVAQRGRQKVCGAGFLMNGLR
jgi:hypothetical protein